jgi:D-glycero-D-manno-heptose 1,7-bisphosphate phosphatase
VGINPVIRPAVFLDRDGVINRAVMRNGRPFPPASVDDLEVLEGVVDALSRLKRAGYALVVVTNQPDVARGNQSRETVAAIHARLGAMLPIDEFRVCFHDDGDQCACRKPKPGLLTQSPAYRLDMSVMIGDRWRDIEAGRRAGVRAAVLVDYGYDEPAGLEPDIRVRSLREAADWILATIPRDMHEANR